MLRCSWKFLGIVWGIMGLTGSVLSQPLEWSLMPTTQSFLRVYAEFDQMEAKPGDIVTLILRGFLDPGWHIYSIEDQGEGGPEPTHLSFTSQGYQPIGKLQENPPTIVYDNALQLKLAVHKKEFIFKQQFRIETSVSIGSYDLRGKLSYQMCDNKVCVPLQHRAFAVPLIIQESNAQTR